ncbi:MAG: ABC transporter ATP-binding protein, partial [Anaerolineaceae bacterium]|nr:ABC transporter ATP-binding protein [Anaerolineaceae bacterium]
FKAIIYLTFTSELNNMDQPVITALDLKKTYHKNGLFVEVLKGINFTLPQGALCVIFGPSGGGKSTLLHVLGGIDRVDSGQLEIAGVNLIKASDKTINQFRRDKVGFVFQFYNLLPSFSAIDNVCLPLLAKGYSQRNAQSLAYAVLEQVGLNGRSKHKPGQLSGGEQQRVAIARALVVKPLLVLADEPTGDLDSASASEIIDLIVNLNKTLNITFVIATHNLEIRSIASHLFEMRDGTLMSR